jgi:hypothetical protein
MKTHKNYLRDACRILLTALLCSVIATNALAAGKEQAKTTTVDSGSFGVFVGGRRVATERFNIQQGPELNIATSELTLEDGSKEAQKAELQMTPTGELRRYEWREISPGKAQAIVEPKDQFLIEHVVPNPPAKPAEQPFVLSPSTMMLDDYIFSQREILVWRYLAQACGNDLKQCKPERAQFGVLIPQQQVSLMVALEYAGPEKVKIRGVELDLNRIKLEAEGMNWTLWVDGNLKLIRILVPSENTEVLRD